jgi:hypothetical protein
MKSITLTVLSYIAFFCCTHVATARLIGPPLVPCPRLVPDSNPTTIYSQSPEYLKALLKRVQENRRSADEDALDVITIITLMKVIGYSPQLLGTTEAELYLLLRKVCIKNLKYSLQKIESGKLSEADHEIEVGTTRDVVMVYGITSGELGIPESELERLLK